MNFKFCSVCVVFSLLTFFDGAKSVESKCENKYLQHYEVKGCTPVTENGSDCPKRYICPDKFPESKDACLYKGKSFKVNKKVDTGNPCQRCECRQRSSSSEPQIVCASVECGRMFRRPSADSNCYSVYKEGQCCSVGKECLKGDPSEAKKVCNYKGKIYHYGEKIYPDEKPCSTCLCNEQWTGIDGKSCKINACSFARNLDTLKRGCIPIYRENSCCPIEYFCGYPEDGFKNTTVPFVTKEDNESGNFCTFKGSRYGLGQVLDISRKYDCVTCTCTTPPDFTCIHTSCPGPPNNDYENCKSKNVKGSCCPMWECVL